MRQSTLQAYESNWQSFKTFMRDVLNTHNPLPASPHQVLLFIAKTYGDGEKNTSILNYISAIAYSLLNGNSQDPPPMGNPRGF